MKIKRGMKPNGKPEPAELQEKPEAGEATRFVSKSTGRILVPITASGIIDLARMNRDARKQLTELVRREDVQKQLGFGPPAATFDPEQCKHLYDGIGRVYNWVGKFLLKYPDKAARELMYTEDEKQELGPATATMLDSYAPAWLATHQAFAAWAVVFAGVTAPKWSRANEVAKFIRANPGQEPEPTVEVFPPGIETKQ